MRFTGVRVVLLDIEGTTTPIAFVHDVLFSYATAHARAFLERRWETPEVAEIVSMLAAEHAADVAARHTPRVWPHPAALDDVAGYVLWLIERDRKSPGLKRLQGLIWESGYRAGELRGEMFDDVPQAIAGWHAQGLRIAIYSSGSELAQRLIFSTTSRGDLTVMMSAFFDTRVGAKTDAASYTRVAAQLQCAPGEVLFVSDVAAELIAAQDAGMQVALAMRPGNAPISAPLHAPRVHSLLDIVVC